MNEKGLGKNKLIVVQDAQIGNLKITKAVDENGEEVTDENGDTVTEYVVVTEETSEPESEEDTTEEE